MNSNAEIDKVRNNLKSWMRAFNAKDLDALFALYDPESLYANAGAPLMQGVTAIKPWYAQAFAAVQGTLLFKEEYGTQSGDLALLVGKYYFQPPAGEDSPENTTGRVALVYRRALDGRWLLLFDMDNTPPDTKPADFLEGIVLS